MPLLTVDEVLAEIDKVTIDDVTALAKELLRPELMSAAGVGGDEDAFRAALAAVNPAPRRGCMINVAVSGAAGRMGETVCRAVEGAEDMSVVGRADPQLDTSLADVLGDADVVVDFTIPGRGARQRQDVPRGRRALRDRHHGRGLLRARGRGRPPTSSWRPTSPSAPC